MRMVHALALATVITGVAAVEANAQGPVIGFRLGASLSKADVETDVFEDFAVDPSNLTSFTGGGFVRFGFGSIGIQPELTYVTKGFAFEEEVVFEGEQIDVDGDLSMDYIEIPVLLHLQLGTGSISPYVVAGPAFAFELSCTAQVTLSDGTSEISEEEDCDDEGRKKFDIGAMFGAGLAFPMGPGSLFIDGRYNYGLMNLVDDESDDSFKQRVIFITAGYQIPLDVR